MIIHASGGDGTGTDAWTVDRDGDVNWLDDSGRSSHLILQEATALVRESLPDLAVKSASVPGSPRKALIDVSTSAHLLVMGSRGRGTVRSKLLGSVSAHVTRYAACPVVVTRPTSAGALKDGVLVGADGTQDSIPVIEFAFRQASIHRLPLTVVHCVSDAPMMAGTPRDSTMASPDDRSRLLLAESLAGLGEKYPDVHVQPKLARGLVEECLTEGPRTWDLVVVGRHPVDAFRSSDSTAVLERSRSVVAVVPEARTALA